VTPITGVINEEEVHSPGDIIPSRFGVPGVTVRVVWALTTPSNKIIIKITLVIIFILKPPNVL
jgi:hypothetical protein